jgi:hypothetical protein
MANEAILAILAEMNPEAAKAAIDEAAQLKADAQKNVDVDYVGSYDIGSGKMFVDTRLKNGKYRVFFCGADGKRAKDCTNTIVMLESVIVALIDNPSGIVGKASVPDARNEPKPPPAAVTDADMTRIAIKKAVENGSFKLEDVVYAAFSTERKTYYAWTTNAAGEVDKRWHLAASGKVRAGEAKEAGNSHMDWQNRAKYVFVSVKGM